MIPCVETLGMRGGSVTLSLALYNLCLTLQKPRIGRVQDFPSRVTNAENVDLDGLVCEGRGKVETPWDKDFDPTAVRAVGK